MTKIQREEIAALYGKKTKLVNSIDYVSGWYYKAAEYVRDTDARCAFVSTNSICQGQQVMPIWHTINERFGVVIDFAWRTFVWDSEATDKAHVHVIIVGFSHDGNPGKRIFDGDVIAECDFINPYLYDADNVIVDVAARPLDQQTPICEYGSLINDKGNYIFTEDELHDFVRKEPNAAALIRPYIGATEFINGGTRYILYLKGLDEASINGMPLVRERVDAVITFRKASTASATVKSAERPLTYFYDSTCEGNYLLIPRTSSERRAYLPIGFMEPEVVASDATAIVPDATLYHFGVATSQFHNAWMRVVAGRLKSDYRYAPKTVWNTFPWPKPTETQHDLIESLARDVLAARNNHAGKSLAQMYDGISPLPSNPSKADMKKYDQREYDDLKAAHTALDAAVEAAYGVDFNGDEEKIVAHLFKLYAEATGKN